MFDLFNIVFEFISNCIIFKSWKISLAILLVIIFLYAHFCFLYGKQIINGVADRETCCYYLKWWRGNSRVQAGAGACCSVVLDHSSTHKII